jgi:hypothetical protein
VKRAVALVALVCAAGPIAGCGSGDLAKPDPVPSAQTVDALRGVAFPVYWLGPDYRKAVLTGAQLRDGTAVLKYGQPICSKQSCDYPIVVTSHSSWNGSALPPRGTAAQPICFSHLGAAVLLGCPHDPHALIFSGNSLITLDTWQPDFSITKVTSALRPLSAAAPPLQAPTRRVTCAEAQTIVPQLAAALAHSLRPLNCPTAQ